MTESEDDDRLRVAAALNELGEKDLLRQEAKRLAQQAVDGADAELRERAVRTLARLGRLGVQDHDAVFEQALKDPDPGVRRAARAALSGGKVD